MGIRQDIKDGFVPEMEMTQYGDTIVFRSFPSCRYVNERNIRLRSGDVVGLHQHCEGEIIIQKVTDNINVLICKKCFVRQYVDSEAKTLHQLRDVLVTTIMADRIRAFSMA